MELDGAAIELAAFTTFGRRQRPPTGGSAPNVDSPRRMPPDEFIAHMTTIMLGSINGTCELLGIKIDPDLPLHEGVSAAKSPPDLTVAPVSGTGVPSTVGP